MNRPITHEVLPPAREAWLDGHAPMGDGFVECPRPKSHPFFVLLRMVAFIALLALWMMVVLHG